jgi:NADPH2:quinone reductase
MRAVGVTEFGGPQAMHPVDLPAEPLGPGRVRLRVRAASLAKAEGLTVVADAAGTDEELVRELGADVVVRRGDDVAARIREQFPEGVDGLADGSVPDAAVLPAVRESGVLTTVRGYRGDGQRGRRVLPVMVREYAQEQERLDRLREQVERGELTLRVAQTYPAADAAQAHRRLEAGGVRGRLVLTF